MPKLIGPLFSASASGVFADLVEYRKVNGQAVAARVRTVTKPRSNAQQQRATRFKEAAGAWSALEDSQKAPWKTAAQAQGTNGYRLWMREYMHQNIVAPNLPTVPA